MKPEYSNRARFNLKRKEIQIFDKERRLLDMAFLDRACQGLASKGLSSSPRGRKERTEFL